MEEKVQIKAATYHLAQAHNQPAIIKTKSGR